MSFRGLENVQLYNEKGMVHPLILAAWLEEVAPLIIALELGEAVPLDESSLFALGRVRGN